MPVERRPLPIPNAPAIRSTVVPPNLAGQAFSAARCRRFYGAPTLGSPAGTRSTLVTGVPVAMDTTQGGIAPLVWQRGRAPLVTVWPAASTNGTVDAKHVVPTCFGLEVVYERVTVKVPVKPASVKAAAGRHPAFAVRYLERAHEEVHRRRGRRAGRPLHPEQADVAGTCQRLGAGPVPERTPGQLQGARRARPNRGWHLTR